MVGLWGFGSFVFHTITIHIVGFPYYNDVAYNGKVYFSDLVTQYNKYFITGFIITILTHSNNAWAN